MGTITLEQDASRAAGEAPTTLALPRSVRLVVDADDFATLCAANRDLRLERAADGGLIAMTPASSDGGGRNAELTIQLGIWNKASRLGKVFDSSTGFTLPDGAIRAPDVSWIARERWDRVPAEDRRRFAHVVPDFAVELRSPSDAIKDMRVKMAEYLAHGVRLGWLIDPETQTVEIHRPGRDVETLTKPTTLPGEDVLPGFTLDLKGVLFD
ncbi:Uma2 family endonuclease [Paludisphaera mucosa]|uniref:Uma2 family endonuclease n=1 Tax=Paludisphaera mucosa TaxID=3030827 RepID=A0ABT6FK37_9BACT|nr:Uma2 family endonuclease [Paludisphaera mucosa]MDG3007942.1 Uma2 family endonuclease [Paludisphaera mucosa]